MVKNTIIPGPGHKPVKPQPRPNSICPMISLASTLPSLGGTENYSLYTGLVLFLKIKLKVTKLMHTADAITKIREGSQ